MAELDYLSLHEL